MFVFLYCKIKKKKVLSKWESFRSVCFFKVFFFFVFLQYGILKNLAIYEVLHEKAVMVAQAVMVAEVLHGNALVVVAETFLRKLLVLHHTMCFMQEL